MLYVLFCAIYYYCELRSNGRTQYLIMSFSASVLEFYGTLWNFTFGESYGTLWNFIMGLMERNNYVLRYHQ